MWIRKKPATGYNDVIKSYTASTSLKLRLNLPNCFDIAPERNKISWKYDVIYTQGDTIGLS